MGGAVSRFPIVALPIARTVIVTGANTGIGYEIAKWSAMMGATVILACRSEDRTRAAMSRMQEEFKAEKVSGTTGLTENPTLALEFMKLDLGSFQSTVQFCEEFRSSGRLLHVLFCNAGMGFGPYAQSSDGLEMMLQVNYLSHFIIITKLLSLMRRSGPDCRILLMSSGAHTHCTFDLNTINYTGSAANFNGLDYYGRSKLYQVMQTSALARRLKDSNITINCMHPGVVDTELWRDIDKWYVKAYVGVSRTCGLLRTSYKGACTGIDLATNPKHAGVSGHYWVDWKITTPSSAACSEQKQEALWQATFPLIKQYIQDEEKSDMKGLLS